MAEHAYDLVIRNGSIADGSGGAIFEGDIAVSGGRIAAVGSKVSGRGRDEIDARGKLVTPGFVDVHTHYDGQATWDSRLQPSRGMAARQSSWAIAASACAPCRTRITIGSCG